MIICLASVLRVQDQSVWSSASTLQVYHALLAFITHAKPKASYNKWLLEHDVNFILGQINVGFTKHAVEIKNSHIA